MCAAGMPKVILEIHLTDTEVRHFLLRFTFECELDWRFVSFQVVKDLKVLEVGCLGYLLTHLVADLTVRLAG